MWNPKFDSVRSASYAVGASETSGRGIHAFSWEGLISLLLENLCGDLVNLRFSGSKPNPGMGRS